MKKHVLEAALFVAVLMVWIVLLPEASLAQQGQMPQFLFVQNAKGMIFEKGTITLKGVSPTTLFFSDRPMRMAGHYTTEEFVQISPTRHRA